MIHTNDAQELTISSPIALIVILKTTFGDPNPKGTARRALNILKQGKGDFATYFTQFSWLIAKLKYNDTAKHNALERGVSDDLKDSMVNSREDTSTDERYINLLNDQENSIRARKEEK